MSYRSAIIPAKFARLETVTRAIPKPGPNDILVKINSAAFNPVDWKIQHTGRFFDSFPRVLGEDISGTVSAIGSSIKHFKEGDRVLSFIPFYLVEGADFGAFQEYSLTKEECTSKIPESLSWNSAATLPLAFCTAADGLYGILNLKLPKTDGSKGEGNGEKVLVWGGNSSVGQFAIQLAVQSGYSVVTTARQEAAEVLKSLGAEQVVDYSSDNCVETILSSGPFKFAFDAIAEKATIDRVLACLPDGGKAAFVQLTPDPETAPKNIEWTRVMAGNLASKNKELGAFLFHDYLPKALQDGRIKPNKVVVREGGIDVAQSVLDEYKKNGIRGEKFVINP